MSMSPMAMANEAAVPFGMSDKLLGQPDTRWVGLSLIADATIPDLIQVSSEPLGSDFLGKALGEFARDEPQLTDECDHFVVRIPMPDADMAKISVELDGRRLIVSGKTNPPDIESSLRHAREEAMEAGPIQRLILLPGPGREDGVALSLQDGLLTVTVPKQLKETSEKI
ncbi:MAG: Hsp20/alpha crystallin family protein [Verrucomicrobiota bacterium]